MFGNPEVTPGGRALKFYSTDPLEVRSGEAIKQGNDIVGNRTRIRVVKNKVAPPFRTAEVDIMTVKGFLGKVKSSISDLKLKLSRRVDLGIHTKGNDSDKDAKIRNNS